MRSAPFWDFTRCGMIVSYRRFGTGRFFVRSYTSRLRKIPKRAQIWLSLPLHVVEAGWNVMTHAQKPDFVFRRNGRVHFNRRGFQFSQLLAAEVCGSAVIMLDAPCSEVVRRVLATHSIRQFPLHFPSRASPCAITFHLDSTHFCSSQSCR
jgi:hypothetical protein